MSLRKYLVNLDDEKTEEYKNLYNSVLISCIAKCLIYINHSSWNPNS